MPSSVQAAKSISCELRPTSASSLQFRQALEQRAGKFNAFADGDDDVGIAQPLDQLIEIARRFAIADNVMVADQGEACELIDHVLIVVGNGDFHKIERGRAESFCFCSPRVKDVTSVGDAPAKPVRWRLPSVEKF